MQPADSKPSADQHLDKAAAQEIGPGGAFPGRKAAPADPGGSGKKVLTKGMAEPQISKSSPPEERQPKKAKEPWADFVAKYHKEREEHKLLMDREFQKFREDMDSFLANHLSSFEAENLNVSGLSNELDDHTFQTSSQLSQLDQDIEKTRERVESRLLREPF